LRASP